MPITVCGSISVHHEETGSGPAIVWIPGTGLHGSSWSPQTTHFSRRYRCLSVDLRGAGSDGPLEKLTVAALAGDVAAWMDAVGVAPAVVVGLSLGSAVAQELALARPDLVRALGLVATWSSTAREHHIRRHFESRLYALEHGPLDVFAKFAFWMSAPAVVDHEPDLQSEVEGLLAEHTSRNVAGTAAHFRADLSHETRDRLGSISCPTIVVHGDQDLITLPWYNRAVAEAIPDARLRTVRDAGHLVWLERPAELNRLLDEFLAEIGADTAPDPQRTA
ncbi:Pimeloyl-ACP methyl ester carboxylesterase [Pseudonocardia thermophila]|uniref:Pimeloyl-ACP methyl ester carboxylesterase n=1 Tax=Pseudonocardia thermophila TaxID=1848 RepID=A0A1M6SEU9_PSETH|nr:alpha/beta hydrolase [Pseudonocardia thermophila]SHK43273.1 Pimeloyl-ACP methyl ester carboxylesterase [Pseudonocardia thermophila]